MKHEQQTSDSPSSFRHSAREVALQALYALDLQRRQATGRASGDAEETTLASQSGAGPLALGHEVAAACSNPAPDSALEVFESVAEHFEMPGAAREFALQLVAEVSERGDELDALVSKHARNWRLSRMATVDRNILRLASFELACTSTPTAVILDEAVELARRFGSDASPAFVNGVLDSIARELRQDREKREKREEGGE